MPKVCCEQVDKPCRRQNRSRQTALHFHVMFGQVGIGTDSVSNQVIDIFLVQPFIVTNDAKAGLRMKSANVRECPIFFEDGGRQPQEYSGQ